MPAAPKVTVLLPVHNAEAYLQPAMDSVLRQTFQDFEFLVVNDASTDRSRGIVQAYQDPRIRLVDTPSSRGISAALNRGLDEARGDYIARMDADDICIPQRLEAQVSFLDKHPEIGLCGSWVSTFGAGRPRCFRRPAGPDMIQASLLFENPLVHPSVMFRRTLFESHGLRYQDASNGAEDYELWTRALQFCSGDNLNQVLLHYRQHPGSITASSRPAMNHQTRLIIERQIGRLGVTITPEALDLHCRICRDEEPAVGSGTAFVQQVETWLSALLTANGQKHVYPDSALQHIISQMWLRTCLSATRTGSNVLSYYLRSPLRSGSSGTLFSSFIMLAATLRTHTPGFKQK